MIKKLLLLIVTLFINGAFSQASSYSVGKFCSNLVHGTVERKTGNECIPVFKDSYGQWKMVSTKNSSYDIHSIYGIEKKHNIVNLQSFFDLWAYVYKNRETLEATKDTNQNNTYVKRYLRTLNQYNIETSKTYKNLLKNQVKGSLKIMEDSFNRKEYLKECLDQGIPFNVFLTSRKADFLIIYLIKKLDPSLLTEGSRSYSQQNIDGDKELVVHYLKSKTDYQTRQWLNFERKIALGMAALTSMVVLLYKNLNRKNNADENNDILY